MSRRRWEKVREFALSLPAAEEDFPWGEPVVKVRTKLGQWGWLTVGLRAADFGLLCDWVEESYCSVAPKRVVAVLDTR